MNKSNHMAGKVCLVTGATAGIGKITATALAVQGAEVVIAGRNQAKAEDVVRQIIAETGNDSVDYLLADFSDLQQVRTLASAFKERYSRLDVLVNNAGAFFNRRRKTQYGVEKTFLVNHLAPFLLTNLLLDTIKVSAPARIVNVSSDGHKSGNMDLNDLEFSRFYFGMQAYGRSKLANILFTYELDRRLEGSGVTVNTLHPGHVATDIWRTNFSIFGPLLKRLMEIISLSPEEGADNSIYLASSPDVAGVSRKYFDKREAVPSSAITYDTELAQELWAVSEKLTSLQNKSIY
jgi:retinol dehydrogenase 12